MKQLLHWKTQARRMPLLVRGARQVGKTYLIEQFIQQSFKQSLTVNFEFNPEYKQCFASLNPRDIINRLTLLSNVRITSKDSILFLDEVQECPQALQ